MDKTSKIVIFDASGLVGSAILRKRGDLIKTMKVNNIDTSKRRKNELLSCAHC